MPDNFYSNKGQSHSAMVRRNVKHRANAYCLASGAFLKKEILMGLFDKLFNKADASVSAAPAAPAAVNAEAAADVLSAPVSGKVIPITEVPDPVFSGEILGKGCAVWPEGDVVYAPCDGTVSVTMGHAVAINSSDGIEVLVHIGVDTVDMKGEGFTGYVAQGDKVKAGQPVIKMDRAKISAAGYPDCVVLAVSNTTDFANVELAAEAGSQVVAGAPVLKVTRN